MGGGARHLVRRFFSVLTARPLSPEERAEIDRWLTDADRELFWLQAVADQRHALETARTVRETVGDDDTVTRAALFHDVGKVRSGLGPFRRSMATVLSVAGLPRPARFQTYLDHGPLGAEDLEAVGAEPLVIAFARHHPGPAPDGFDPVSWNALLAADDD